MIIDAMQGETSAIPLIDARLAALASTLTADIPGISLTLEWAPDANDVWCRLEGYGPWLNVERGTGEQLSLVEAALAYRLAATGLDASTISTLVAGTTMELITEGDAHAVMEACEADMEGLLANRLEPRLAIQRMLARHAETVGVASPLDNDPTMRLDHLRIDADVLEAWLARRPPMSIVRDIRATMMGEIGEQQWHGPIDDVTLTMLADGPMLMHNAMISEEPPCHFDGVTLDIEQDLPDTILGVAAGRDLGDIVATGMPGLDSREILGIEENSLGFEITLPTRVMRLGNHPGMAQALAVELAENIRAIHG